MIIDNLKLNKIGIISHNNKYLDENKQYFNTTIKRKKHITVNELTIKNELLLNNKEF